MTVQQKLKPFDLAKALAGAPVITRNGCQILDIQLISGFKKHCGDERCVVVFLKGQRTIWVREDGSNYIDNKSDDDLFIAPEKKTGWIAVVKPTARNNVYTREATQVRVCICNTKEIALKQGNDFWEVVDAVEIEWFE